MYSSGPDETVERGEDGKPSPISDAQRDLFELVDVRDRLPEPAEILSARRPAPHLDEKTIRLRGLLSIITVERTFAVRGLQ